MAGHWLVWSAHSAAGHPLLKTAGVSEAVGFSLFTETAGFQLETQIYVIALYDVAGTGMAELIWAAGVVGAAAYVFSWFWTIMAYYQTYLNNLLSYALVPWDAWLFIRAIVDRSPGHLLAAAILLFASITSNAQVAIKMAILAVSWAPVEAVCCHEVPWRRGIAYCTGMLVAAGSWAAFLLALAMALRVFTGYCILP